MYAPSGREPERGFFKFQVPKTKLQTNSNEQILKIKRRTFSSRCFFNDKYIRIIQGVQRKRGFYLLVSDHHRMDSLSINETTFLVEINRIFFS
jgi:hypothetical protein